MTPSSCTILVAVLCTVAPAALGQTPVSRPELALETVYWDTLDADGRLTGGVTELLTPRKGSVTSVIPAPVQTLSPQGESFFLPPNLQNRLDLVVVGDGYTAAQLSTYANQVSTITASFFNKEPYLTYSPLFLVHRVDVVSAESGVDNDPTQGVSKNTALDMGYWCNGIDRLLCVNVTKAYSFANNAPDVDLVLSLANSGTYGGAGYPSNDLATSAAANGAALEIVRHEFGHALGNLADEYTYGGPPTYAGGEPGAPNSSKLLSAQMQAQMAKWWRWLGTSNAAFDGLVSTYEGSSYSQFGIYRPTQNSLMRNLNRPFNLPSAEAVIIEVFRIVKPIDDASTTDVLYQGNETLFVTPVAPLNHPLKIQWSKDGVPLAGATGTTLDLATLALGACATISVKVWDDTTWVKDEAARAQWMTQQKSWQVQSSAPFTSYCTSTVNSSGQAATLGTQGTSSLAANDLVLQAFGCPPNVSGIFFFGPSQTQVPLGNGWLCASGTLVRFPVTQTNLLGDAQQVVDLDALPGGAQVQAGDVRNFQLWFRDTAGGGAGTNTTNGMRVSFCP